jgi:DNA-directed RNA polymerase alpha subunit
MKFWNGSVEVVGRSITTDDLVADAAKLLRDGISRMFVHLNSTQPKPGISFDASVEGLELPTSLVNILQAAGILRVRDLARTADVELLRLKGVGRKSVKKIKEKLLAKNLSVRVPPRKRVVVRVEVDGSVEEAS